VFFCKKKWHIKKDCYKHKTWLGKKGNHFSFVCFESNMAGICHDTWFIDSGTMIQISNTMQGFSSQREPNEGERFIYSRNRIRSHVAAIGTCRLNLGFGFVFELNNVFYIPEFSRNLIFVSRLVPLGYSIKFNASGFDLLFKSTIIGNSVLNDGLFKINLSNIIPYNLMATQENFGIKHIMNEKSSKLWHRRLGHISIERIKRLVNDGVLRTLDFSDFCTCVDYIKGKQTNKIKKNAKRSSKILKIIHTDICCPDMDSHGQKYFISFIDDYS